jgi:hypothetical protein
MNMNPRYRENRIIERGDCGGDLIDAPAAATGHAFNLTREAVRRVGKGALAPCPSLKAAVGTLRFAHPTSSR